MPTPLRTTDRRRAFGSLNTGRDISALADDECPVLENVEHGKAGALTKRLGRFLAYEVATQPQVTATPLIVSANVMGGSLPEGSSWDVVFTYVTVAGETDDVGASVWVPEVNLGDNALTIQLPLHMRKVPVEKFYKIDSTTPGLPAHPALPFTYMIRTNPSPPLGLYLLADPTTFDDFLVYDRAPRIQDETHLGANYLAETPLYDRTEPLAKVYAIGTWDGGDVFVLSSPVPQIGQMGTIDRDTVDIMLPAWERRGLPIKYVNIYAREHASGDPYEWIGWLADGNGTFTFSAPPSSGEFPPSLRVARTPVTLAASYVRDVSPPLCGGVAASTNIPAGVYGFRYTLLTADPIKLNDPGWDAAWEAANISGCRPLLRCEQETWPSTNALISVLDGQAIEVTRPALPTTIEGWNLYAGRLSAHRTLTFEGSVRDVGMADINPKTVGQSQALYYGNQTVPSASFVIAQDTPFTEGPQQSYALTKKYDEFYDTSVIIGTPLDPFDPATRGFAPGYPDVRETIVGGSVAFSYASSRDTIKRNRTLLWWYLDAVTDSDDITLTTQAALNLTIRIRPGMTGWFDPTDTKQVSVRRWVNDGTPPSGGQWIDIKAGMGLTSGFATLSFPFPWDASDMIADATRRFMVLDITAFNGVGYDVTDVSLDLFRAADDGDWRWTLQLWNISPETEAVTLKHPLALTLDRNDSLRLNPTAMWPVNLPRPESRQETGCTGAAMTLGCCDSVFLAEPTSGVRRVYQYEGIEMQSVVEHDYRFVTRYGRCFVNNAGRGGLTTDFNLRYDGLQTFPHGIDYPHQRGSVTAINEPLPGPGVTEDLPEEYYLVYERKLIAPHRGYVARSAPGQKVSATQKVQAFTDTVLVNVKEGVDTSLLVEGNVRPEPQVTHLELYRNRVSTAEYYRTVEIPITESLVQPDGSVQIRYDDSFDGLDADLTLGIQFETGRPPSALFAYFHQKRYFFVSRNNPGVVGFTNVTSPGGEEDAEGWFVQHTIEPDIPVPLTCLSPYGDGLAASSNNGMVPIIGVSDDDNGPGGLSWGGAFADKGWVGPDAWINVNAVQYGMTQLGPGMLAGSEIQFIGHNVRGTVERFQFTPAQRESMRAIQNSALQRTQVWFTLPSERGGCMDECLILDEESLPTGLRRYWALWTQMDVHGATVQHDSSQRDAVYMGGQRGRVYSFGGRQRTDAGVFIACRADTKPFVEGEIGKTFGVRWIRFFVHGSPEHTVLADYRMDMWTNPNVNAIPLRQRCNDLPSGEKPIGSFLMGGGAVWGKPDQHLEIERRRNVGRVMHQIQVTVGQQLELQPVGEPRESTFELAGYVIQTYQRGQRVTR